TCARCAAAVAAGTDGEWQALDMLAWALLANGQDHEAAAASADALAKAPASKREWCAANLGSVVQASERAAAQITAVGDEYNRLTAEISTRRTFRFAARDEATRFLHDTLSELLGKLASTEQQKARLQQRLEWARQIGNLSRNHPNAHTTWDAVRAAIARA